MNNLSIKTQTVKTQAVNFIDENDVFCGSLNVSDFESKVAIEKAINPNTLIIVPPEIETKAINFIDENDVFCGSISGIDGQIFINDVPQNIEVTTPVILNNGSIITKEIQTTNLIIENSSGTEFLNYSAMDGKLFINGNAQNSIYGAYITNGNQNISPNIDSNGNAWLFGNFRDNTQNVNLYDKYNEVVGTLYPNADSNIRNFYLAHISSDGYSNCWIAKIETLFNFSLTVNNQYSKIDSKGNFILSNHYIQNIKFYDKNGYVFGNLDAGLGYSTFVVKYSPNGAYTEINENILDPNMWASRIISTVNSLLNDNLLTALEIDKKDNIVICGIANNLNTRLIEIYDKTNIIIDTIDLTSAPQASFFMVKYASNGMKNDESLKRISWSAYIKASPLMSSSVTTYQPIAINSMNDIIITGRYRNANIPTASVTAFTYDGQIGLPLLFSGNQTQQDVFILSLNEDGLSSKSWRNTITSANVSEISDFVVVDSNDNIIISTLSGGSSLNPVNIRNQDNTVAFSYIFATNSICVVKYTPSGVPLTFVTLRATGFFTGGIINIGAPSASDNYSGLILDKDNNVIIKGIYSGTSLTINDDTNTIIQEVIKSGNTSGIGFIAKVDYNNQNVYLTTFGSGSISATVSPFTGNIFPAFIKVTSLNEIVIVGFYIGPNCVFYTDSDNTTPTLSFTNGTSTYNGFILKYDSNLNNCKVCRLINLVPNVTVIPQLMTLDSEDSIISCIRYGSISSTGDLQIFNFDNNTETPDTILTNEGLSDIALVKIATSSTNSWNSRISGINETINNFSNQELIAYSFINTDKYNNIYFSGLGVDSYSYYDSKNVKKFDVNFTGTSNFFARYPSKGY